jgi:hypothetical protein
MFKPDPPNMHNETPRPARRIPPRRPALLQRFPLRLLLSHIVPVYTQQRLGESTLRGILPQNVHNVTTSSHDPSIQGSLTHQQNLYVCRSDLLALPWRHGN